MGLTVVDRWSKFTWEIRGQNGVRPAAVESGPHIRDVGKMDMK
jgi:hypothetical protein